MFNGEALRRGASKGRGSTGARRGEVSNAEAEFLSDASCTTLPFCTTITGAPPHRESNDLMIDAWHGDCTFAAYALLAILIRRYAFIKTLQRMSWKQALILYRPTQLSGFPDDQLLSSLLRKI